MKALCVVLVGANGRMGKAIAATAKTADAVIVASLDLGDDLAKGSSAFDVIIDFSHPAATREICGMALKSNKPMVIGTTGHSKAERALVERASKSVPIVFSPNFSLGINALFWLTRKAAEMLGEDFDLEITEAHHRLKKDAPSGTAKRLAEILCDVRELDYRRHVAHGREGLIGERPAAQIGVHSIRGGDVVGDHAVMFVGHGEQLELTHRATSREGFARGALRAARWVVGRPAGLYSMEDVIG